jgi:hypothetical protein
MNEKLADTLDAFAQHHMYTNQIMVTDIMLNSADDPEMLRRFTKDRLAHEFCTKMSHEQYFEVRRSYHESGEIHRARVVICDPAKLREFAEACFEAGKAAQCN